MIERLGSMQEMLQDFHNGVYDFTENGKCIECGSCCSKYLPLSMKEINHIRQYIKKNNIKRQYHGSNVLAAPTRDYLCPFLDDTKANHKCTIYEIRPLVCREFVCNKWNDNCEGKLSGRGLLPVDVTATFFPKKNTSWPDEERIIFYK